MFRGFVSRVCFEGLYIFVLSTLLYFFDDIDDEDEGVLRQIMSFRFCSLLIRTIFSLVVNYVIVAPCESIHDVICARVSPTLQRAENIGLPGIAFLQSAISVFDSLAFLPRQGRTSVLAVELFVCPSPPASPHSSLSQSLLL